MSTGPGPNVRRLLIASGILAGLVAVVALVGTMLPQGHVASRAITLRQPRESVWAVITDYAGQPAWRKDVTRVEHVGDAPGGAIWREDGDNPLALQTTESVMPSRLVRRIADTTLPFGGRWVYRLEATAEGGTRLTVTEEGEVYNPFFRVASLFMEPGATIMQFLTNLAARFGEAPAIETPSPNSG